MPYTMDDHISVCYIVGDIVMHSEMPTALILLDRLGVCFLRIYFLHSPTSLNVMLWFQVIRKTQEQQQNTLLSVWHRLHGLWKNAWAQYQGFWLDKFHGFKCTVSRLDQEQTLCQSGKEHTHHDSFESTASQENSVHDQQCQQVYFDEFPSFIQSCLGDSHVFCLPCAIPTSKSPLGERGTWNSTFKQQSTKCMHRQLIHHPKSVPSFQRKKKQKNKQKKQQNSGGLAAIRAEIVFSDVLVQAKSYLRNVGPEDI